VQARGGQQRHQRAGVQGAVPIDDFDKALSVLKSAIDARKVDRAQQDRNEGEIATSHALADASGGATPTPPETKPK
jgi:hypothetical protein